MATTSLLKADFWKNKESIILLNPRLDEKRRARINEAVLPHMGEGSVWIKSSGTESSRIGEDKIVKLSKDAILVAAESVNKFYKVTHNDVWLNTLPLFHIGGLSILARCFKAQAKVLSLGEWSAQACLDAIRDNEVSVISLVPTQVYDLVNLNIQAPSSMRLVLVGGGALDEKLYIDAKKLGWPVVPSYGMTETSAMIAGAELTSIEKKMYPLMKILDHVELTKKESGYEISSESLFDGYLFVSNQASRWVPLESNYRLDDRLVVDGKYLSVMGRESDLVKILGETVDIKSLESVLKSSLPDTSRRVVILAKPHERSGFRLEAVVEGSELNFDIESFNKQVLPFERVSKLTYKDKFLTSELGKILKHQLS